MLEIVFQRCFGISNAGNRSATLLRDFQDCFEEAHSIVLPSSHEGAHLRTLLSFVSIFAALLLLVAGILLCAKLPFGRRVAYWATALSVPVCIFSALIHLMGAHALLYGVGYPIVIVTLLHRATPSSGIPSETETAHFLGN